MPDAVCRMVIKATGCPPRLSASIPESIRSRNDPTKNKGPVTEVSEPLQFPVSVDSTAGNATFLTRQGNESSKEKVTLS